MATKRRTFVVGVGMTKFEKPKTKDWETPDMAKEAVTQALDDAKLPYSAVEAAITGYNWGESTCGQRAVYEMGLTGIPVINVNNNCSTGSTALYTARKMVEGSYDCVLALGFEKMEKGLTQAFTDRPHPCAKHFDKMYEIDPKSERTPVKPHMNAFTSDVIKLFAYAAREHMEKYGTTAEQFAKISYKNFKHSTHNPRAIVQREVPMEWIMMKKYTLMEPITMLQASPTADGAAAAIVCSEKFVIENGLQDNAVEIVGQELVTDLPSSFEGRSYMSLSGYDMAKTAAQKAYAAAGLTPNDINVAEVHDCFSPNELFMYEALGLCPEGKGGAFIDSGKWIDNGKGGEVCLLNNKVVVNPSGGLESKGHPTGATGLGQCAELNWQLRGAAGGRQVPNAKVGIQHNFGIGGAAVVTIYRKPNLGRSKL